MHYPVTYENEFSTLPSGQADEVVGQREHLSTKNILALNDMYQCKERGVIDGSYRLAASGLLHEPYFVATETAPTSGGEGTYVRLRGDHTQSSSWYLMYYVKVLQPE